MTNLVKTFLLGELVKRHGRYAQKLLCAQRNHYVSRRENTAIGAFPRPARTTPVSQRRRALHCLQIVRSGVSGLGHQYRVGAARRRHPPHHPLRYRSDQNAFSAAFAKKPARWMRLWKRIFWNITAKNAVICITPNRCCWPSAIAMRAKLPNAKRQTRPYR